MVDTIEVSTNGDETSTHELPALVHFAAEEARRIPSPGTQRALKAQTGRSWDELCGPDADAADRFQTMIWMKLRRDFPGLRWDECADVDVQIDDEGLVVDPTQLAGSVISPPSAGSGG